MLISNLFVASILHYCSLHRNAQYGLVSFRVLKLKIEEYYAIPPQFQVVGFSYVPTVYVPRQINRREHLLLLFHGPIVAVQSDRPRHPALSPITAKLLATDCVSCFKDCWRIASRVHKHQTCHSIIYTACVMPSVDNIRRGSHAAARDVFQLAPMQKHLCMWTLYVV